MFPLVNGRSDAALNRSLLAALVGMVDRAVSAVSRKLRRWVNPNTGRSGYTYWCQGCDDLHRVVTEGGGAWGFNGNVEQPTFTPSVVVNYPANPKADLERFPEWLKERRCHTFITDGMVQFLGDCTHALAGKTEPLPDLPDHLRGDK
jgi:hypothetical protein